MSEFAGTLRERILIEQPISVRNEMGLQEPGWEEVCRCLASIVLASVGQQDEGQALSAMQRYRVTIRARDGITLDQRISWNDRKLMVRQLLDDPLSKDRIGMLCEEVRG
ncbi:MAG TPA: head-tail adaptor protein [Sphingomicrobium sp.]|nr:head-tail adaptor protein [Sphingomicrobium sp.]